MCKNIKDGCCWFVLIMELKMVLLLGCSVFFVLIMYYFLGNLFIGMEVLLEIRGWKIGGFILGS